ncbi:MAG TPA: hypothetical protein VK663_06585 [Burkholderiales bacterium]|nr:hypothetical protein [Burkholderiales bacterium]
MKKATALKVVAISIAALSLGLAGIVFSQQASTQPAADMSFFITSTGLGKGADLGGLAGADRHCQSLAAAAGAGKRTWHAYLSTTGTPAVNARDRVGKGPWYSFDGRLIARNVDELHTVNNINRLVALNEKGKTVNGRADKPSTHDIMTGSLPDGRASAAKEDTTCGNWTKSGEGAALLGHHDRSGLRDDDASRSWNSSHPSRGCSQDALVATGGAGLIYCFATN